MTPEQSGNLKRLLSPRSIACIGGNDAAFAIALCSEAGFDGPIWGVNPHRNQLGGRPCYRRVEDLPYAPDVVFLAIPAVVILDTIEALCQIGAGGVVCFTAGFGETGEEGGRLERQLVRAAGGMALVGPNCSGVLNFIDNAMLWPFVQGGNSVDKGVALITQSGMLGNTFTLNQRSVTFSYIISSGNQAMLGVEDYLEVLIDDPAVTGIGLYIERLDDIPRFAEACIRALQAQIPIIVHKAGTSEIGSRLTITHTGSLSGSDEMYQALFDRLGIVRVRSPVMLLEALKMLTVAGPPRGTRVAAFTCSGGDATMIADEGERLGLLFPQPSPTVAENLTHMLPDIATVSNPLDYTTPLWGDEHRLPGLLTEMLSDHYDAAVMVQDYPAPELGVSREEYQADTRSFISAVGNAGIPGAVCSCLPENLDRHTREMMINGGVAPLQGINDALQTIAAAAALGMHRHRLLSTGSLAGLSLPDPEPLAESTVTIDEWEGKRILKSAGIQVPEGQLTNAELAPRVAPEIGFPVAVKMVSRDLPHKTEAGALKLGVTSALGVIQAVDEIKNSVSAYAPHACTDKFLIERMVVRPVAEILLGVRHDDQFGLALVVASGGTLVELIRDSQTLLLPTDSYAVDQILSKMKLSKLLDGYRGGPQVDREMIVRHILKVAEFAQSYRKDLVELDINPSLITEQGLVAVDALLRTRRSACMETSPGDRLPRDQ